MNLLAPATAAHDILDPGLFEAIADDTPANALAREQAELILRKGFRTEIDSYSVFFENDHTTRTGLAAYLRERNLSRVFLVGLAYDYCVGYSALDAQRSKIPAAVLRDACRAIDLHGSAAAMEARFAEAGVALIDTSELSG